MDVTGFLLQHKVLFSILGVALLALLFLLFLQVQRTKKGVADGTGKTQPILVHILYPIPKPAHITISVKPNENGELVIPGHSVRLKFEKVLEGKLTTGRREVWIDGPTGAEIVYAGLGQFGFPDPRVRMSSRIADYAKALQTRGIDWAKYAWPAVVLVVGLVGSAVLLAAFAISSGAKG